MTHIGDKWTTKQFEQDTKQVYQLAKDVAYPVALMVFLSPTMGIPSSGFVESFRTALRYYEELGLHTIVYITRNPSTALLWKETINSLAADPSRYFVLDNQEAGLRLIAQRVP